MFPCCYPLPQGVCLQSLGQLLAVSQGSFNERKPCYGHDIEVGMAGHMDIRFHVTWALASNWRPKRPYHNNTTDTTLGRLRIADTRVARDC